MVAKCVQEPVSYTVMEPVFTPCTKRICVCEPRWSEEPFCYQVCQPVWTSEERLICTCECVTKQVPCTVMVSRPVYTPEKRCVCDWVCEPQQVTTCCCVCRQVPVSCCDPCTGCMRTYCQTVHECVPCTKTVMCRKPVMREITVNVCHYVCEPQTIMTTCVERHPVTKRIMVPCCHYVMKTVQGSRRVCTMVPVEKEVQTLTCSFTPVVKTGTVNRTYCEPVKRIITVPECYTEWETYSYKVCVPVCGPVASAPQGPAANAGYLGCGNGCNGCGANCYQSCGANNCCESGRRQHFGCLRHRGCCTTCGVTVACCGGC